MGPRSQPEAERRLRVVSIGISRFANDGPRPLPFAAADARAYVARRSEALSGIVLTDAEATSAAIRDVLLGLANATTSDEAIEVFVASHASVTDGDVSLQCYDNGLPLGELLKAVWNGPVRRVVLLLDFFRGGTDGERPTAADLIALFPPRAGCTLLLADDGANGSHVSGELQAGIWAAQVTAAFSGATPRARESDGTLTAGSLRAFLADEIPRSLFRAYTDGRRQSPAVLAASDEEILAELAPIEEATEASKPPLAGLRFFSEREVPVKTLGGFRKSVHSPPSDTLSSSKEWVARLAEPDLAKEIEEATARLRRHLGYKRRDLRADAPTGGAASVLTPDFAYHITARQHPTKPDRALFRRTLTELRNTDVLGSPTFAEAFPQGFLSLHCPFETAADLEALIDAIEDAQPAGLARLDYPTDLAYCELELAGFDGKVRVEKQGVTMTASGPASPADLAARFAYVKRLLGAAGVS